MAIAESSPAEAVELALDDPTVGRAAVRGALIGFVAIATLITGLGTAGGLGVGASAGIGVFVGVWGGSGFGFMMGATTHLARHPESKPHH